MLNNSVKCPKTIFIDHYGNWILSDNPYENVINIRGRDYLLNYLDDTSQKNKGGNSFIFKLFDAQEFEENDDQIPDLILKISKAETKIRSVNRMNQRFSNEINALKECNRLNFQNVIKFLGEGELKINKKSGKRNLTKTFQFYTMEYAQQDLKQFVEEFPNISIFEKTDLCLQIAKGLNELNKIGFYHRDLKPDNIFIVEKTWKIGDLGLIAYRKEDYNLDNTNELIGPRGWFCPEAMNKYLTENKNFVNKFDCAIDHQSDIFQMGKIFWYIFQGNAPIGSIKRNDFKIKDERIYEIIRRMINHSKSKRFSDIDEVIALLKPIHKKYLITT